MRAQQHVARQVCCRGKSALNTAAILATGKDILVEGVRGTESTIRDIIRGADSEIHVMAYVISEHATWFLDDLQDAIERGIATTLVINRLQTQDAPVRDRLRKWNRTHPHFVLCDYDVKGRSVHAKVVVADRNLAVVGSANFSWRGMAANCEIGVLLEGKEAWMLSKIVDRAARLTGVMRRP